MVERAGPNDDAATALVLASPLGDGGTEACFDHLAGSERQPRKVLNVLFTERPERRIANWERHVGELPETFVVVTSQRPSKRPDDAHVEVVGRPGDLTNLGVTITEHISEWSTGEPTAFCLDSATAQLQYADREQVYKFLHTLCRNLVEREVVGHVHMNPAVHDERTVDTFGTLFDAVVRADGEGETITPP